MKKVAVSEDSDQVTNPNDPQRKSMLQRQIKFTLDAAKDRAKGVKREGSIVDEILLTKLARITIVEQEESETIENSAGTSNAVMTKNNIGSSDDVEMNPTVESKSDSTSEIIDSRESETIGNSLKLSKVANPNGPQRKIMFRKIVECASDATKDRARGVKREGGIVEDILISKLPRSNFIEQEESETIENSTGTSIAIMTNNNIRYPDGVEMNPVLESKIDSASEILDSSGYLNELLKLQCVDVGEFNKNMFNTYFGKFVLFIQPRTSKLDNIQASCQICQVPLQTISGEHTFSIKVNNRILAETSELNQQMAKQKAEELAWDKLIHSVISVLEKDQSLGQDDTLVGVTDSGNNPPEETLGTPESSVTSKMRYQTGGRLGLGRAKKRKIKKITRADVGCASSNIRTFKKWAATEMKRFVCSWSVEEISFSTDFSKAERDVLHQYAYQNGLICIRYQNNSDKCLAVKKEADPFSKVRELVEEGGSNYFKKIFIPIAIARTGVREERGGATAQGAI